jgi:hypothetical protein
MSIAIRRLVTGLAIGAMGLAGVAAITGTANAAPNRGTITTAQRWSIRPGSTQGAWVLAAAKFKASALTAPARSAATPSNATGQ